jgi:hypothetical protein
MADPDQAEERTGSMRSLLAVAVVICCACGKGGPQVNHNTGALECAGGETAIYKPTFPPASGGSGVASAADAREGYTSSDSKGSGPATPPPAVDPGEPLQAMTAECGQATCAPGLVAVEIPAPASGPGGGIAGGVDDVGAPPTPDVPPAPPAPTVKCAVPPPTCPTGQSAQYTSHDTWECTDCAMVVTYGGIFGNYRRCVSSPTLTCPGGQVPTYSYELETWECKPTCDNGMYDQHTINGQLVCVPC